MSEALKSPVTGLDSGNISNHEVPDDVQSETERKLAELVLSRFREAKRYRATWDKDWERYYRLYAGQHWDTPRPEWRSDATVNFIFSTIETILPIMTDSSPTIHVVPAQDHSNKNAEILGEIVKRIWVSNRMQNLLPRTIKNALKYGTGIQKVWWDPNAKNGLGDVAISNVDPRHFFPSPGALDIQSAHYVIFAANVPLDNVLRDFPEAKGRIKGGVWDEDLTVNKNVTSQRSDAASQLGPVSNTAGTAVTEFAKGAEGRDGIMNRDKLVTLVELWSREDDGQTWVTIMANGVLLKHTPNPFNHNRFPFVRYVDYDIPSCFWGMGEIQQLEKLQLSINQRRAQTQDILRITASPPFVADSTSGINPKAMTNRPGTIIFKREGSQVNWLTPPNIPSALFTIQEMDKMDFDSISGVLDVTQGRKPAGIEAASAIAELQEAAQTRIRFKVRTMETSITELGEMVVSLVQQFYTEERVIRIVGPTGSAPQFIAINQQAVNDEGKPFKINDVTIGEYEVEIGVGSTMPINKSRRANQMIELFQLGVVDRRAVLENVGLPPEVYEKIIARMEAQEAAALAAQAGEMGAGMAPAVPAEPSEEELAALEMEG